MAKDSDLLWKNISALPYFRAFLRTIEGKYLQKFDLNKVVLDLGCGDGYFAYSTFPNMKFIGIDPSFPALLEAKKPGNYKLLVNCKGDYLPVIRGSIDTVISNSVLEHIDHVDSVIGEIHQVLKNGGQLLVTMPNDNFTKNLSVARTLDRAGFKKLAGCYRKLFNKISRHFHTDNKQNWELRFRKQKFSINISFNYFTARSLQILEFGHYFGLPTWFNKQLFGRWILFPNKNNPFLWIIYKKLMREISKEQRIENGAYTLIGAQK